MTFANNINKQIYKNVLNLENVIQKYENISLSKSSQSDSFYINIYDDKNESYNDIEIVVRDHKNNYGTGTHYFDSRNFITWIQLKKEIMKLIKKFGKLNEKQIIKKHNCDYKLNVLNNWVCPICRNGFQNICNI